MPRPINALLRAYFLKRALACTSIINGARKSSGKVATVDKPFIVLITLQPSIGRAGRNTVRRTFHGATNRGDRHSRRVNLRVFIDARILESIAPLEESLIEHVKNRQSSKKGLQFPAWKLGEGTRRCAVTGIVPLPGTKRRR